MRIRSDTIKRMNDLRHHPVARLVFAVILALCAVIAIMIFFSRSGSFTPLSFRDLFPAAPGEQSKEDRLQVLASLASASSTISEDEKIETLEDLSEGAEPISWDDKLRLIEENKNPQE